jgi:FKBP-type peptidyl-prolyl cis-trans isomerase
LLSAVLRVKPRLAWQELANSVSFGRFLNENVRNCNTFKVQFSDGIISAFRQNRDYIQITAPISPGSSGSPVLDDDGKVIGMATLINVNGQNPNFAISQDLIKHALESKRSSPNNLVDEPKSEANQIRQETRAVAERNKADGKKFLDENAKKEGVKTTASGLQYKVIKEGTGEKPEDSDFVETNYRGTTIDGKEFDSSGKTGGPVSFPVAGVIKGWSEALKMMPVGSKWQIYIPSYFAYGDEGAGEDIAPGSTLIFDIELLRIYMDKSRLSAAEKSLNNEYTALRATLTKRQKEILRKEELSWLHTRESMKGNATSYLEFTLSRAKELRRRCTGHEQ